LNKQPKLLGEKALVIDGFAQGREFEIAGNRVLIVFFGHYNNIVLVSSTKRSS
jgi:hypothetical protein